MKKRYILITLIAVIPILSFSQGCLPNGITFETQDQIDNFQANHPGCTQIEGNMEIRGSNIINLDGLNVITSIDGTLTLRMLNHLTDFSGLNNLQSIGKSLNILANASIVSLSGLESLTSIGLSLQVWLNISLQSMDGLNNLIYVGTDIIFDANYALTAITGLESVTSIHGTLDVRENEALNDISGFSNVDSIYGHLVVYNNNSLTSLAPLGNLEWVEGVSISTNHLTDLTGFESLSRVEESFLFWSESVTSLNGLNNLNHIGGDLHLKNLNYISNIDQLISLSHVGGWILVEGHNNLMDIDGLGNLSIANEYVKIHENQRLRNANGLKNLGSIGGALNISYNDSIESIMDSTKLNSVGALYIIANYRLQSLHGLDSLKNVTNDLTIALNDSLGSLSGIDNISAGSIADLDISYNSILSECAVKSICDYLANPNGTITIGFNAPGCENQVEVEAACTVGIPESIADPLVTIFPNPAHSQVTIKGLDKGAVVEVSIFNNIGQRVIHQKGADRKVDVSSLQQGMYAIEVIFLGRSTRIKFLKN